MLNLMNGKSERRLNSSQSIAVATTVANDSPLLTESTGVIQATNVTRSEWLEDCDKPIYLPILKTEPFDFKIKKTTKAFKMNFSIISFPTNVRIVKSFIPIC